MWSRLLAKAMQRATVLRCAGHQVVAPRAAAGFRWGAQQQRASCSKRWAGPGTRQQAWRPLRRGHTVLSGRCPCGLSSRCHASLSFTPEDIEVEVGLMVEGEPSGLSQQELDALAEQVYLDSAAAVKQAALYLLAQEAEEEGGAEREEPPKPMELSVVLCDDDHIRQLNLEWRGKDTPTDVLSFELQAGSSTDERALAELEGEEEMDGEEGPGAEGGDSVDWDLPVTMLGDIVISVDTAARQAAERGHSLLDECRILLLHGLLHLLGYDHEQGQEEEREMAAAEQALLRALGWRSNGLISAAWANGCSDSRGNSVYTPHGGASTSAAAGPVTDSSRQQQRAGRLRTRPEIQLVALDMDGTLLDSRSQVLPSSVAAIKAALARGITVMLATGKARPAAIRAMQAVGLAGDGLVVSTRGPGVFLQGLAAYGRGGALVAGGQLDRDVVRLAFEYAQRHDIPLCGFLGEDCVTLAMHPELQELHHRYYEPLARVAGSVDEVLAGPPLRKLLFMSHPHVVDEQLKPHWEQALEATAAQTMQAVPEMLEVVPSGWDKARALRHVLSHMAIPQEAFMAVGDGGNDLSMVSLAGLGVAMGNAVPEVKAAAAAVVASNDEGGVAQAIEQFVL